MLDQQRSVTIGSKLNTVSEETKHEERNESYEISDTIDEGSTPITAKETYDLT